MCFSRVCPKQLDFPLLHPVQDADAGDHVDVFCVLWDRSSDCRLLCRVRRSRQEQWGLFCRLQTSFSATFCERCRCGKKVVGGQWENGETSLMVTKSSLFVFLNCYLFILFSFFSPCPVYMHTLTGKFKVLFFSVKALFYYASLFSTN